MRKLLGRGARAGLIGVVAGGTLLGLAGPGFAGVTDITPYAQQVEQVTLENLSDQLSAPSDNITCQPTATVEGSLVTPQASFVVGEIFGQTQSAGNWSCTSLDTSLHYTITGIVTDWYAVPGGAQAGCAGNFATSSLEGTATAAPVALCSYPAGSAALNTWHWAVFNGFTSTGHRVKAISAPEYYVPAV